MKHNELLSEYERQLEWIDRRTKEKTLEFYGEDASTWKHAKEIAFHMYENLRHLCDDGGGFPTSLDQPKRRIAAYKHGKNKFPCVGVVEYRREIIPVYSDDYGMRRFMVYQGHEITYDSIGGMTDWYFEVDRYKDKICD